MVRALGKLLDTVSGLAHLLEAGGEGDPVPGRTELRRFSELLSHKDDFLKSKQKTEDIKLLYDELLPSFFPLLILSTLPDLSL